MRCKSRSRLWIYFALIIFGIMLATAFIMIVIAVIMFRLGHLTQRNGSPLTPIIFLLFISVLIGTVISAFVAKKILNPITRFSKAAREVAKGNFNIRLDKNERIEEIREMAHNFNLMVQELSSIETLRNDFVVNVSHEFKTPIAAIEGYAMLLQDKELLDDERCEYTQMIIDSARQLATLSGNILSLSKLENQEVIMEKKQYRLDEQIRQAVLLLESEWSQKELDLHIELDRITYYGNERLLMQVWMNIIGNAIKFTHNGGNIHIGLIKKETEVNINVADNGCGMKDTVKRHIFDKFYQGDTARKADGNGLGLALAKRIVDLCDGIIEVESKVGEGTVFTVILPLTDMGE